MVLLFPHVTSDRRLLFLSTLTSFILFLSYPLLPHPLVSLTASTPLAGNSLFLPSSACKRPRGPQDQPDSASDHPHGRHPHAGAQAARRR